MTAREKVVKLPDTLSQAIDKRGRSRQEVVETDLTSLYALESFALREIKNEFNIEEFTWLVTHCILGLAQTPLDDIKSWLLVNIKAAMDERYSVENREGHWREFTAGKLNEIQKLAQMHFAVLGKVTKMSRFHVYCLVRRVNIALELAPQEGISPEDLYKSCL